MYLRALEIQGFKSFPERTRLTFEKDITAIVGPNGSGKSNIADALMWVMGEQRSKTLRGGKMEDVIFGGTEKRSPMGFAQVSLILDNTGGLFDLDAAEVTLTRRYYRTGESEYFINREQVRLRDITSLLMDTGLGRDGYSVIGQGRIDEIVSARSTDRREIFEGAAGISRYRWRKEEAERKLAHTDENLVRINDKIDELELQVEPLRKQSETAKKYLRLRDEQKELEISVWMETLDRLHTRSEELNASWEGAKADLERAQSELQALYSASETLGEKMREKDAEAESVRQRISSAESSAAEQESAMAVLRATLGHNNDSIARAKADMGEQTGRAEELRGRIAECGARIEAIDAEKVDLELKARALMRRTEENAEGSGQLRRELDELMTREAACADTLSGHRAALGMLADRAEELQTRRGGMDGELERSRQRAADAQRALGEAEKLCGTAKERLSELTNIVAGHKRLMSGREQSVSTLTENLSRLTVEKRSAESRAKMLEDMEREYEGLGKAVKSVMRAVSRGTLSGIHGPVAGLVTVDDRCTVAIETALGAAMQNIVVDTQDDGKAAIEMLKRTDGGRATFLPISAARPQTLQRVPIGEPGFVGVASSLVSCADKYSVIFASLLGRTVVVETLADAVRISKKYENRLRIVSLDGQMINAGGSMTGGSAARNVGILSRANELKKLRAKLEKLTAQESECAAGLQKAKRELERARAEQDNAADALTEVTEEFNRSERERQRLLLERSAAEETLTALKAEKDSLAETLAQNAERTAERQREAERAQSELDEVHDRLSELTRGREELETARQTMSEQLAALREQTASLASERAATERTQAALRDVLSAMAGDESAARRTIEELEQRNADIQSELAAKSERAKQLNETIAAMRSELERCAGAKLELEGRRTRTDRDAQAKNRELLDMQSVCAGLEQRRASAEMEEKQIIDKLWDSYELSRTAAQELRKPVESMPQAQKRVSELRREISKLGPVSVGAIEEYDRVKERYDFLTGQRDDVETSRRELEKIIADITSEMKEIFIREFKAIDESFRGVFLDLFGGGKAALVLEDENDVLECGIDIKVQPPGKAVTTISLLSGGEKSFVAIALYFAIMKIRPTPFCIMDEVEAALDDVNVTKCAEYMRSMCDKTQFIVITHRRGTMEEADILYGVTMQEKGVTTVISVDLDEAEKTIA